MGRWHGPWFAAKEGLKKHEPLVGVTHCLFHSYWEIINAVADCVLRSGQSSGL